jgi:hypothetical protein
MLIPARFEASGIRMLRIRAGNQARSDPTQNHRALRCPANVLARNEIVPAAGILTYLVRDLQAHEGPNGDLLRNQRMLSNVSPRPITHMGGYGPEVEPSWLVGRVVDAKTAKDELGYPADLSGAEAI